MKKAVITIFIIIILTAMFGGIYFFIEKHKLNIIKPLEFEKIKTAPNDLTGYEDFDSWQAKQQKLSQELLEAQQSQITFLAVGDIMMSRAVEKKMIAKQDFSYCLAPMKKIIQSADIAFANLESPIIEGALVEDGSFKFRANPQTAASLLDAGFDIVSLANNHFGDFGEKGMLKTFDYLTQKGLLYVGAGNNKKELVNPLIVEKNNLQIAFLAYAYGPQGYQATDARAGMALMDEKELLMDLQKAKSAGADLIIVSMHAGVEYSQTITDSQSGFAHLAIDNGADLVIGHHPHVVQKMEIYKEKYIFYSLGNFVFDQMWSLPTRQGLAVMFTLDKSGVVSLDYYPVQIEDYCRPVLANDEVRDEIIEKL